MGARTSREPFRIFPEWMIEDLDQEKVTGGEFTLLVLLWFIAERTSGIVRGNAGFFSGLLGKRSHETTRDRLRSLKRKRYLWYGGETLGYQRYEIYLDRFELGGGRVTRVHGTRGELVGAARAIFKKLPASKPLSAALKTDPQSDPTTESPGSDQGSDQGSRAGTGPPGQGLNQGSTQGSPVSGGLTIAGLSPSDGGSNLRVPPRVEARVQKGGVHSVERRVKNGSPQKPPQGAVSVEPPAGAEGKDKAGLQKEVLALEWFLALELDAAIPGFKKPVSPKADLDAGARLFLAHGIGRVKAAIVRALAHDFYRQKVHSFRSLERYWNQIQAVKEGNADVATKKSRRNHRAAPKPEPEESAFRDAGDVAELARGIREGPRRGDRDVAVDGAEDLPVGRAARAARR